MIDKIGGVTRISLLMLMITLCIMVITAEMFALIYSTGNPLDAIMALFKDVMLLVAGSFFTKSAMDAKQNTITTTVSKDLPEVKKDTETGIIERG